MARKKTFSSNITQYELKVYIQDVIKKLLWPYRTQFEFGFQEEMFQETFITKVTQFELGLKRMSENTRIQKLFGPGTRVEWGLLTRNEGR